MISNNQVDLDVLIKACECLKEYFVKTNNTERKPVEIFLALLSQSTEYIESGYVASDLFFDANDICRRSDNVKADYLAAKDFITRHRKGFDKLVKDNIKDISHFCSLNNVGYLPIIKSTDSSGGHKAYFYIDLIPLSDNITLEVGLKTKRSIDSVVIEYSVPQLPKAVTWAKPLLNLKISGWKFYSYIGLPILAFVIAYCLLLWNLFALSNASLIYTIIMGSVLGGLYYLLVPFYEAISKRIGIAPVWLTKLKIVSSQLRYVRTESKRSNGKPIRALQLVVYQAKCPICGNEVLIEKGKYAHKGRLVGVCDESPREHIFSFDHATKRGKLISYVF
ncbi:MAG: hypothetical protein MJK15_13925 [Colwellia sp.]|nr:hypothetical protein [Colwellia sp.]